MFLTFNNGVEINKIKRAGFRSSGHIRMRVTMQNKARHAFISSGEERLRMTKE